MRKRTPIRLSLHPFGVMVRLARFLGDPRDQRQDAEVFEVVGMDDGVFGCIGVLACHDYCPKNLPLATQMHLRRKLARASLRRLPV